MTVIYHLYLLHINHTSFCQNNALAKLSFPTTIYLYHHNLLLASVLIFTSNTGFGLELVAVKNLTFDGLNIFYNNSAKDIMIMFNNTIPLFIGENVFTRNTARIVMCIFKYVTKSWVEFQ